jgi:hypothetical protein
VAETTRRAREEAEASTMLWFRTIVEALRKSPARMNVGGLIPHERILDSVRLFADRVIPRLG